MRYFSTQMERNTRMLLSIRDTTTILALNFASRSAGMAVITIPVTAPTTSRIRSIIGKGSPSPILMAARVAIQPENMKIPSPERLNLFTAYIKQKQSPVNVKGIARLIILPTRLTDENGPSTNCSIM